VGPQMQWEAAEFRHWQTQSGGVWWSSTHKQIYPNIPNLERKCKDVLRLKEAYLLQCLPNLLSLCIDSISSSAIQQLLLLLPTTQFDPPSQIAVRNQAGQMICIWVSIKLSLDSFKTHAKSLQKLEENLSSTNPFLLLFWWVWIHWKKGITKIMQFLKANKGVCHTLALPFTFKSILRQKKNDGNSSISPCKNIIFKKHSLQETKILEDIITLY
jgi:hypothetical protein